MRRWPEPRLEPAQDQSQDPKEPSSLANSREDDTKASLDPSHPRPPPFLVLLVYCSCQALWVSLYVPLLGFSMALANLASYSLSLCVVGFYILWRSSLQTAGALTLILARKLCAEVVLPIHQALRQPWMELRAWSLTFLRTLFRWVWGCTRTLGHKLGMATLSWVSQAYRGLLSFSRDKGRALEVVTSTILQRLLFTLLMSCLKGFWAVYMECGRVIRGSCSQLLDTAQCWWDPHRTLLSLETCAASLSSTGIPLSLRFPGPEPSTFSWLSSDSISLCSLVVQRKAEGGAQGCPWGGSSQLPLNIRFHRRRASPPPSGQALVRQVKTICVLIILLYIYGASLFIQILK